MIYDFSGIKHPRRFASLRFNSIRMCAMQKSVYRFKIVHIIITEVENVAFGCMCFFLGKRSTNKDKHPTQQLNFKAMNDFLQLWLLLHPTETEMHVNHMLNDDVNVSGLAYK